MLISAIPLGHPSQAKKVKDSATSGVRLEDPADSGADFPSAAITLFTHLSLHPRPEEDFRRGKNDEWLSSQCRRAVAFLSSKVRR